MEFQISHQLLETSTGFTIKPDRQIQASFELGADVCPTGNLTSLDMYCIAAEAAITLAEKHFNDFQICCESSSDFLVNSKREFQTGRGEVIGLLKKVGHKLSIRIKVSLVDQSANGSRGSAFQQFVFSLNKTGV